MEYEDIGQSREWEDIEYINKGWSDDKKYKIKTRENEELLLKISDIGQFAKKKKEFEIIKDLEEKKILMPKAVDIGVCNNDQSIYSLYTWIKGEDAAEEISKFSEEEQYKLGVNAGRYLKEIHSVNAPKSIEDWESRFNRKIDKKIENYKKCGVVLKDEKKILEYINKNRVLLKNRAQCLQHGDYHIGNMIITPERKLGIIDFNRYDYGDPWEEFNRIVWSAEVSPEFASGYINGYFDDDVPELFFKLLLLYICSNEISSVYWAQSFGEKEMNVMIKQVDNVMEWYDQCDSYIPKWYHK